MRADTQISVRRLSIGRWWRPVQVLARDFRHRTPMTIARSAFLGAAARAALGAAPAAAQATADEQYAGRVRALALGARCRLFSDEVNVALESGAALSRNALLRGGWSDAAVRRATVAAAGGTESL